MPDNYKSCNSFIVIYKEKGSEEERWRARRESELVDAFGRLRNYTLALVEHAVQTVQLLDRARHTARNENDRPTRGHNYSQRETAEIRSFRRNRLRIMSGKCVLSSIASVAASFNKWRPATFSQGMMITVGI